MDKKEGSIRILHLSDLHVKTLDGELSDEIAALADDIAQNFQEVDYIALTGDLTYSGQESQFEVISKNLLPRIRSAAHVGAKNIIVIPGNHDVDRSLVSGMLKMSIAKMKDCHDADTLVSEVTQTPVFKAYVDFVKNNELMKGNCFDAHGFCKYVDRSVREFHGEIEFACFNSAWSCVDDRSKGEVFLSAMQTDYECNKTGNADIRIALVHHDLEWLHESENKLVERIKSDFDVVLAGHVHRDNSMRQQGPKGDTLLLTGACFAGDASARHRGYNVYDINPVDGKIKIFYRKYVADDRRFAENVDYVPHGEWEGDFKSTVPLSAEGRKRALAYVLLPTVKDSEIVEQLRMVQGIDRPIYIPPALDRVMLKDGRENVESINMEKVFEKDVLLYAPRDCGKTLFLKKFSRENRDSVYIDCADVSRGGAVPEAYFKSVLDLKLKDGSVAGAIVMLDHLKINDSNELSVLRVELYKRGNPSCVVIATSSEFLFNASLNNKNVSSFSKVKIREWGVKVIEEFARKFWAEKFPGNLPQIDYLKTSLMHSDLPITPVIVAVFISLFAMTASKDSSASLTRLMERIAEIKFGANKYNYMDLLVALACKMHKEKRDSVLLEELRTLIAEYFDSKNLDYELDDVLRILMESRFLVMDGTVDVRFPYYIFKDYFIACAIAKNRLKLDVLMSSDSLILSNASALVLYGSIIRDDARLVSRLFDALVENCGNKVGGAFDFSKLDDFISYLFLPLRQTVEEERLLVDEVRKRRDQYKNLQAEFEENRSRYLAERKAQDSVLCDRSDCSDSFIERVISLLKAFYNIYRNLENLSAKEKESYLDVILEFHVYCNLMIIQSFKDIDSDREFRTIIAYVVTIGGQLFMRFELFSPALRRTILHCLDSEKNDFKRFLLISLYADGRFDGYEDYLASFAKETSSYSAIEMVYFKVRQMLITYREENIPDKLMSLFKTVVDRRNQIYKTKSTTIADEVTDVKRSHWKNYHWGDKKIK